jgi:predicted P-loop ATPase
MNSGKETAADYPFFPDRHRNGVALKDSIDNVRALCSFLGVTLKFNAFANRTEIFGLKEYKLLNDNALTEIWALAHQYHFKASRDHLAGALDAIGLENTYHPVRDYFDTLHWDGVPRLDKWLTTYAGAEDTDYVQAVGAKTLLAAVRRVRRPGTKHDAMLVLEGPQHAGKSSALRILAIRDEWFSDGLALGEKTREVIEQVEGCLIVEIPELKGMKHSEVETIKAFLSRQSDKARKAYGRYASDVPRQFVFIGTTNPDEDAPYLKDRTGNRRFWPVRTAEEIDIESLKRDRDLIWAEAVHREAKGESLELPRRLWPAAKAEQEKRVAVDPLVEALDDAFGDMLGRVLVEDVWTLIGKPDPAQRKQWDKTALGQAMRQLGWKKEHLRKKEHFTKESKKKYFYTRGVEPYREIVLLERLGLVCYAGSISDDKRKF